MFFMFICLFVCCCIQKSLELNECFSLHTHKVFCIQLFDMTYQILYKDVCDAKCDAYQTHNTPFTYEVELNNKKIKNVKHIEIKQQTYM